MSHSNYQKTTEGPTRRRNKRSLRVTTPRHFRKTCQSRRPKGVKYGVCGSEKAASALPRPTAIVYWHPQPPRWMSKTPPARRSARAAKGGLQSELIHMHGGRLQHSQPQQYKRRNRVQNYCAAFAKESTTRSALAGYFTSERPESPLPRKKH